MSESVQKEVIVHGPKFRKKTLRFQVENKQILKFVKERCQNYFNEVLKITKIDRCEVDGLEKLNERDSQPRSSCASKPKKGKIFVIRKEKKEVERISREESALETCENMSGSKIRAKSSCVLAKQKEKQVNACLPLCEDQSENSQNLTSLIIQKLRNRKQNERRIQEKQKIQKQKQSKKHQRIKTFINENKCKQICKLLACSYSGSAIPIVCREGAAHQHWHNEVQCRVLQEREVQDDFEKKNRSRTFDRNSRKSCKDEERSHGDGERRRSFKQLEMYSVEDSEFLRNFYNLKFNSRISEMKSKKETLIPENILREFINIKSPRLKPKDKISGSKQKSHISVANPQLLFNQLNNQTCIQPKKRSNECLYRPKSEIL